MLARPEWTAAPPVVITPIQPSGWKRVAARMRVWRRRIAQRHALAALDERGLRDIGVTRVDAMREAAKPFWRG